MVDMSKWDKWFDDCDNRLDMLTKEQEALRAECKEGCPELSCTFSDSDCPFKNRAEAYYDLMMDCVNECEAV